MHLTNESTIKELMRRHGLRFSKTMGQNFIVNPSVCPRMAELGGASKEVGVLEIGPGIGVLTRELAQRAGKVVALELDRGLIPLLGETLADFDNVRVLSGDAMKMNLPALLQEHFAGMRVVVCANLPYYITSPMLMKLLEDRLAVDSITVMVQKEAAARICAPFPSRQAGAITAAVNYYSDPAVLFPVSRGSFLPAPNVDSAVIRLNVRPPKIAVIDEKLLFAVIRGSFAQRRKTILNSISAALGLEKSLLRSALLAAGVAESSRAEQLSLEQFACISGALRLLLPGS